MILPIIIKEPKTNFATSTPVESYSLTNESGYLNVRLSKEEKKEDLDTAIAKSPDGGIVELAFSNTPGKSPETINIVYQF